MQDKEKIEPALKIDTGFKINILCLKDEEITMEQKESIALMIKASLERGHRILERNQNQHLAISLSKEEQDFINQFLPAEQHIKLV
jgi:hypothetical protein